MLIEQWFAILVVVSLSVTGFFGYLTSKGKNVFVLHKLFAGLSFLLSLIEVYLVFR